MAGAQIILGVDTSLRSTGYGVVAASGSRLAALEFGVIRNPATHPHSACLLHLHQEIEGVLTRAKPVAAAIEGAFFFKNARTAMILGEARGVVIAACAVAGVPVYEYPPRQIKQSLTGFGGARKEQIQKMVIRLLGLAETPQEDAADALAIALCHLHNRGSHPALQAEPL